MATKHPRIGLLMMLKNEQARLKVSLQSVKGFIDCMIIYDTGSTDKTIDILKKFSRKNKIPLHLKQGEFVNFEVSRNVSLDFADTVDADYLLLMDCNDELRNGNELLSFLNTESKLNSKNTAYLIKQQWYYGNTDVYLNVRVVKNRTGWRYKGVVHEYITNPNLDINVACKLPDTIILYQDRTLDTDGKSQRRFSKDRELLLEAHKKDPTEPRTIFYLAQTLGCLNEHSEAYYYYKLRTTLTGFMEEVFHSYLRLGQLAMALRHPWEDVIKWYIKAYESRKRVEPLVAIANFYKEIKDYQMAFMFISTAAKLKFPIEDILFINKIDYDYNRWHILGICGYYTQNYIEGKIGCLKAIEARNLDIDKDNLKFYEGKI